MSYSSQSSSGKTDGSHSSGGGSARDLKRLANGRYRIINQVGRGGMSVVYHAYDTLNDRDVAIKVLSLDLALEESFLLRFRRESELMRDLSHPNVLRAYDYGQDGEIIYLVMSYYGGGTLKERITGPVPLRAIADYLSQIAAGLGYAHSRNIVHRDVKPSNVLIHHASESLVLSDFGIARALSSSNSQRTGTIMGTPLYMAPEQFLDRVDQRTDIYALGVVLYQMLTGEVPFKGEGIGFKHLNDPVPPLSAWGLDYDPTIEQVVMKAMAKRPDERFQKVEEMAAAFNQAVQTYEQSPTGLLMLEKPTLLTKADKAEVASWSPQLSQPALPGQDTFSSLPLIAVSNEQVRPAPAVNQPTFTPPPAIPLTPPNYVYNFKQDGQPLIPRPNYSLADNSLPTPSGNYRQISPQLSVVSTTQPEYTPTGHSAAPTSRANWVVLAMVIILVVGFVAVGGGVVLFLSNPNNITPTATSVAQNTTPTLVSTPQLIPGGGQTSLPIQTLTAQPGNVTASPGPSVNPTVPVFEAPRDFQLVYVSRVSTTTEVIYTYDPKTGSRKQLTDIKPGVQDTNPIWVMGGQGIIFQSDRLKGEASIWLMASDGKAVTKLIDHADSPAISNGGAKLVYVNIQNNELYSVDLVAAEKAVSANQPVQAIQLTHDGHKKLGPNFSPDNSKLIFSEEDSNLIYQLYTLDLNSLTERQILRCQTEHCVYPVWSPDGTRIAYNTAKVARDAKGVVVDDDRFPLDIFVMAADGSKPPQQLTVNSGANSRPFWVQDNRGNDGTRIYFNSDRGEGQWARIYTMNPDGTNQKLLFDDKDSNNTENQVDDFAPSTLLQ